MSYLFKEDEIVRLAVDHRWDDLPNDAKVGDRARIIVDGGRDKVLIETRDGTSWWVLRRSIAPVAKIAG